MREDHVPSIGVRFWGALVIASACGAALGDFTTAHLALGTAGRMLVFAVVLAAIFVGERYDRSRTETCYWLVVIVVQAASTKLADFSVDDLGLRRLVLVAGLAVLLTVTFTVMRSYTMHFVSRHIMSRAGAAAKPLTDAAHWTAMLLASTAGAAVSDFLSAGLALGPLRAAMILSVVAAASFLLYRLPSPDRLSVYWIVSTVIRALGSAVADLLGQKANLTISTALTGATLIALLLLWPKPRQYP